MRPLLKIISILGLLLTLLPSFFVFMNLIDFELNKALMIVGSVLWFSSFPFWIDKPAGDKKNRS